MNGNETKMGLGLVAAVAVCCGAKLLLVSLGLSGWGLLTGQTPLIAAGAALTLAAIGLFAWRRSRRCTVVMSPPEAVEPSRCPRVAAADQAEAPSREEVHG